MSESENNPPNAAGPSKALQLTRIAIAMALFIGVTLFGIFAIQDLQARQQTTAPDYNFGAIDQEPGSGMPMAGGLLPGGQALGLDPNKFVPIDRENPHPGEVTPYQSADAFIQPPYRQPNTSQEVWEFCAYRVKDGTTKAAFEHYNEQAKKRGLKLLRMDPTSSNRPGGIKAAWSDGKDRLELTAWPTPNAQPPLPPLKPATPLDWVVKYSYPASRDKTGR